MKYILILSLLSLAACGTDPTHDVPYDSLPGHYVTQCEHGKWDDLTFTATQVVAIDINDSHGCIVKDLYNYTYHPDQNTIDAVHVTEVCESNTCQPCVPIRKPAKDLIALHLIKDTSGIEIACRYTRTEHP